MANRIWKFKEGTIKLAWRTDSFRIRRQFELWREGNTYFAQDVLCRGIVGEGTNPENAMHDCTIKLGSI